MKEKMQKILLAFVLILLMMGLIALPVSAANRSAVMTRFVMGGGGLGASTGSITLQSTLGQPVTERGLVSNASLQSGFWTNLSVSFLNIFLPVVIH